MASATANPGSSLIMLHLQFYRKSYLVYMIRCELLDENGNVICGFDGGASYGWPYPSRIEIVRSGTTAYLYVNGVQKASAACSSQPYNIRFVVTSATSENYNWLRIDDVVIGTTGYPNIIGIIPEDWYVLEHPHDPRWSGLYDGNGNWIYQHTMHVSYGLAKENKSDANTTIVLQAMGAGSPLSTIHLPLNTYRGIVTLNITELLINNPDARPGFYYLKLMQGDDVYDYGLFAFTNGGGTISFDADSYVTSQTAIVSHEIPIFTIQDYIYKGQIVDINGAEKTSWLITTQTGTHSVDLADYSPGTYFLLLKATDRVTGEEYVFDFDTADVNEEIWVNGTAYDAETGSPLAGVTVGIGQFGTITSNVTLADGSYATVKGLYADNPITVNASKTGYTHNNFSFTPLGNGLKTINLYLIPSPPNFTGAAIGGLVHDMPYRQPVGGATVTIANGTWSNTTIANTTGYYIFNDLAVNESYNVSSTLTGYQPSGVYPATAQNETFVRQDIEMSGLYTLTLELRDATDHSLITTSMTVRQTVPPTSPPTGKPRSTTWSMALLRSPSPATMTIMAYLRTSWSRRIPSKRFTSPARPRAPRLPIRRTMSGLSFDQRLAPPLKGLPSRLPVTRPQWAAGRGCLTCSA